MIHIAFLLPALFLSALLTFFGFDLVQRYTQAQEICRDHLLRAEKEMGDHLSDLLALNPLAEKLRAQEKILKIKLAANSANPSLVIYYQHQLALNYQSQVNLQLKQQQLIRSGEWGAKRFLIQLRSRLKSLNMPEPHLYVEKKPLMSIAGSYEPQTFFSQKQNLQVKWQKEIDSSFLKWQLSKTISGECSATLKKGEGIWNAHINDEKFKPVKFKQDRFLSRLRL